MSIQHQHAEADEKTKLDFEEKFKTFIVKCHELAEFIISNTSEEDIEDEEEVSEKEF